MVINVSSSCGRHEVRFAIFHAMDHVCPGWIAGGYSTQLGSEMDF